MMSKAKELSKKLDEVKQDGKGLSFQHIGGGMDRIYVDNDYRGMEGTHVQLTLYSTRANGEWFNPDLNLEYPKETSGYSNALMTHLKPIFDRFDKDIAALMKKRGFKQK
jgi:hypothetical protein